MRSGTELTRRSSREWKSPLTTSSATSSTAHTASATNPANSTAKRIAIIGAGFAGLSVGCYARMNGYEVDIFEQHDMVGGLCTAWERQGYTFDGCIHWLVGSNPDSAMGHLWRELGVLRGQTFVDSEVFQVAEGRDGRRLTFYSDLQRLRAEMLRVAPEDRGEIDRFIALVEKFGRPDSIGNLTDMSVMRRPSWLLTWVPVFIKYGRLTIHQYAQRFKNPFLRWAFEASWDMPEFSIVGVFMTYAWLAAKNAGYPVGGSLKLAGALEQRARELGCRIHLGTRVEKVLVEGGKAVGLRLAGGTEHRADYVVGAGDLHSLIYQLLDGTHGSARQKGFFDSCPIFEPIILLSYGVRREFADHPLVASYVALQLPEERVIAGAPHRQIMYRIYNFDPTFAPAGSTVVQVMLQAPYEHWKELAKDRARYLAAKKQAAADVADILEARFPGFKAAIAVTDVASPTTFERYTWNWRGSFEGWLPTPKSVTLRMPKTLEGLDGLYLAGQWVQPGGGLPSGAMTGRQLVQTLCRRDGKEFHTSLSV